MLTYQICAFVDSFIVYVVYRRLKLLEMNELKVFSAEFLERMFWEFVTLWIDWKTLF